MSWLSFSTKVNGKMTNSSLSLIELFAVCLTALQALYWVMSCYGVVLFVRFQFRSKPIPTCTDRQTYQWQITIAFVPLFSRRLNEPRLDQKNWIFVVYRIPDTGHPCCNVLYCTVCPAAGCLITEISFAFCFDWTSVQGRKKEVCNYIATSLPSGQDRY